MPVIQRTRSRGRPKNPPRSFVHPSPFALPPFPQYGGQSDPGPLEPTQGGVIHGVCYWPGVVSPVSCTYTCSHGVSPGIANLTCLPQDDPIATHGNLVLYDGNSWVTVPAARMQDHKITKDERGEMWHLEIADRRWRWRECGTIDGCYNQRNFRNYFIPWTVRFPRRLFELCLEAMGETGYEIVIPIQGNLPAVNWDYINPARALDDMAESLGCRVVYRLDTDTVAVVPLGSGLNEMPDGPQYSIFKEGPSQKTPDLPDSIVLLGAPVRYQAQFMLTAVGEEWDGKVREINELTYKPEAAKVREIWQVLILNSPVECFYRFQINDRAVVSYRVNLVLPQTPLQVAQHLADLHNAMADPPFGIGHITALAEMVDGVAVVSLDGPGSGESFTVAASAFRDPAVVEEAFAGQPFPEIGAQILVAGDVGTQPWVRDHPSTRFENVRATDRLTKVDAMAKAQNSVYKWYAIMNLDVTTAKFPASLPGFGKLDRIFQLLPETTKVEDVTPERGDETIISKIDAQPIITHFYDGFAREMPAECFGAYYRTGNGIFDVLVDTNTKEDARVLVPFEIDHRNMVVKFQDYVFILDSDQDKVLPASIRLETAFQVRHPTTHQVVRYAYVYVPPGPKAGTGPAVFRHDDVFNYYVTLYAKSGRTQVLLNEANATRVTLDALAKPVQKQARDAEQSAEDADRAQDNAAAAFDTTLASTDAVEAAGQGFEAATEAIAACHFADQALRSCQRLCQVDIPVANARAALDAARTFADLADAAAANCLAARTACQTFRNAAYVDPISNPAIRGAADAALAAADKALTAANAVAPLADRAVAAAGNLMTMIDRLDRQLRGIPPGRTKILRTYHNNEQAAALARYYLLGHLANYQVRTCVHRGYNGIVPIACDGSIHQVTWNVGPGGTTTEASLHGEHSTYIPSLPERRKLAYLSPVERRQNPIVRDDIIIPPGAMGAAKG